MSGHGGGNGGGGGQDATNCLSLLFTTTLNSPNPEVLADLEIDDELEVRRSDPNQRRIIAVAEGDRAAGSITHRRQVDLARCMEEGVVFVAIVQRVSGGACDVQVRPEA